MREIKFEYLFLNTISKEYIKKYFRLEELESFEMDVFLLENSYLKLIARREYTGWKDKNKKEVYNGDTLKCCHEDDYDFENDKALQNEVIAVVKWGFCYPAFDVYTKRKFDGKWLDPVDEDQNFFGSESWVYEVIGNKFENHELLDEVQK